MVVQIIINSIVIGSMFALIASGFTLIYGAMNFFNMAFGTTVLSGAYTFYFFYRILNLPIIPSGILACVFTSLLMLIIDRAFYYGFRQKRNPGWSGVAASMAVGILLESLTAITFGTRSRSVYKGIPKSFSVFGAHITTVQTAILFIALIIILCTGLFLKKTRIGKIIRAIADNREMAKVVGIDVEKAFLAIITISSVLATIAGALSGLNTDIRPGIASSSLLKAIVASIIGGVGNARGALAAGLLIGFLETLVVFFAGGGWRDAVPLVLIVAFMLIRPEAFGIEETKA